MTAQQRNLENFERQMQSDKTAVDENKVSELEQKIEQQSKGWLDRIRMMYLCFVLSIDCEMLCFAPDH